MHKVNKMVSKTKIIGSLLFSLAFLLLSSFGVCSTQDTYKIKKVVIDAGHGGRDNGAVGKKGVEKEINLSIALKLGAYLEKFFPEVEVIYTRTKDVFVGLDERSQIANESGADLFISIHCNANPSKSPYGSETYVMGLHKSNENLDVAMRENAVIAYEEDYSSKYEGYDPNSAESFIIFNLMQHSYLEQSLNMASFVQTEFNERARRKDRGVKQAGFLVLWKTSMPSVLVEVGFLSNSREEEYLINERNHDYLASAIFRAFRSYKEHVESRSTFTAESSFTLSNESTNESNNQKVAAQLNPVEEQNISETSNKIQFKVQITASSKPIPTSSSFFKNMEGVEEVVSGGIYKYLIGSKIDYSQTVEYLKQVRELFPDAFIVAFMNGNQISVDEARKINSY
ncbi:MAG TPA: N-acetylmuramoyl-L-alanine amidase [Tenuifilaceae bacterium]|nr:N-acetylmuramoyl-L-alanine amidase [Tenuifilaceae bacterium]HPJ44752.1 N-acetylmuramoyl-L-alanine amidase [Tenuifilaceae bacterium]HPQ33312.1 N-acetylmuramoyl-L-alanine amidase [Tenuifilaceae bacterium]